MPYRRYTKKRPYRRRQKTRWAKKRSIARQPRSAIADSQLVRLVYGEQVNIDAGAGTTATAVFAANDLYDPNVAVGGHQPRGFDQWMAFYNHFCVIGARIKVTFMSQGGTAGTDSFLCAISVHDDTTTGTSYNDLLENTGAVTGYCGTGTGAGTKTLYKKFSSKKFFGVTNILDDDKFQGTVAASPAEQAFFHITVAAADGSSDPNNCSAAVQIEYIAVLRERKNLVES